MKPETTFKIFAVFFCSIVLASAIHAQEKVVEYKENPVNLDALALIADQFADRLTAEPLTTRGFINVYDNTEEAAKIKLVLSKKLDAKDRITFYKPGIRYAFDDSSNIEFWIFPSDKKIPYEPDELFCVCPTVGVEGNESVVNEKNITFTANVRGGNGETVTYNWKVSAGKIIEGQGTSVLRVRTKGAKEITAAVEIGGVCDLCLREASFTTKINGKLEMIDAFGYESSGQIRYRLDNLLTMLNNNPTAKGYIINYGSHADKNFLKTRRTQISEQFTLRPPDLTNRITVIDGGYRANVETELWISFDDSQKPVPTPTFDAKFVGVPAAPKKSTSRKSK